MRVLVILPEKPTYGGACRFLERLLTIHDARGIETALLVPEHCCDAALVSLAARHQVRLLSARSRSREDTPPLLTPWFDLLFSWRSVSSWRPDLLVVSTADPGRMSAALYFPLPVLYILHSTPEHVFRPLPRLYLRTGARLNNRIATVSKAAARSIASTMGFPADAVAVLYNSTAAVQTGPRAGLPVVVTAGHLVQYKDPFGWLEAAQAVLRQKPETTFVWLGDGELLAPLRERVDSLGLRERILLPGFVPDPSSWLDQAQVYFQPSLRESHGIAVLEAMARRLPCVVADTGGLPESVLHGETGFVSPPGDTGRFAARILDLLQDPALREKMGHAAALRVESHFSESEQERTLMTWYRQLVKEPEKL
jgi:glycosyltransferase involved in cell wall biosynthesis